MIVSPSARRCSRHLTREWAQAGTAFGGRPSPQLGTARPRRAPSASRSRTPSTITSRVGIASTGHRTERPPGPDVPIRPDEASDRTGHQAERTGRTGRTVGHQVFSRYSARSSASSLSISARSTRVPLQLGVGLQHRLGVQPRGVDDILVTEEPSIFSDDRAPTGPPRARRPPGAARGPPGTARSRPGWPPPRRAARAAGVPPGESVTSRQRPGNPPRPTRPRSWCSCETPNLSASRMTMTEALGTSTPTSMTVVATSTSISPAGERRHHRVLLLRGAAGRAAPPTAAPAADPPERLGDVEHGASGRPVARSCGLRLARRGSSPSSSASPIAGTRRRPGGPAAISSREPRSRPVEQCGCSAAGTTCVAIGAAPGGQLGERGDVEVAEHRHRDRARDGRGGHDEHVRAAGPGLARGARRAARRRTGAARRRRPGRGRRTGRCS